MDFNKLVSNLFASLILVLRNFFLLIFSPYKTIRKISNEKDYLQVFIILIIIFLYFKFAYFLKGDPYPATITFLIFIFHFSVTVTFFYILAKLSDRGLSLSSFIFTLTYSLIPTLVWFASNSLLYVFIPPPRTFSILGKGFSIFFIAYSISLLSWKIILTYLALRFSTRQGFYRIVYILALFLVWFIPYSLFLYQYKLFRIPFI